MGAKDPSSAVMAAVILAFVAIVFFWFFIVPFVVDLIEVTTTRVVKLIESIRDPESRG